MSLDNDDLEHIHNIEFVTPENFDMLKDRAERGNAQAAYLLGCHYFGKRDVVKATFYLEIAEKGGSEPAPRVLDLMRNTLGKNQ